MKAAKVWWQAQSIRDRRTMSIGIAVLATYLIFAVAVQPAWRTVRSAPKQIQALEVQLQTMQQLAAEARDLRGAPPITAAQSSEALKAASERLGDKAKLSLQGDRAVLTLTNASTEQLRGWLTEARSGARARPVETTLTRSDAGYSGTIIVAIAGAS